MLPLCADDLTSAVAACAGKDIVDLQAAFLRFCRAHAAELGYLVDDTGSFPARVAVRRRAAAFFRDDLDSDLVDRDSATAILRLIKRAYRDAAPPLVSLAFAEALDEALGYRFVQCFGRRDGQHLAAGDLFPVVEPSLKDMFGSALNTRADTLATPIDGTRQARLIPQEFRHDVRVSFAASNLLASMTSVPRVGLAFPNERLSSTFEHSELIWDRYSRDELDLFFRVRPSDEQRQLTAILNLLARASDQKTDFLLFPELSFTSTLVEELRSARMRLASPFPRIIVAGSAHIRDEDGVHRNRSTIILETGETVSHDKFEQFAFHDDGDGGAIPPAERHEDITHRKQLILLLSDRWSLTVLICKDFMAEPTVHSLVQLRTRLALVPALSPKAQALAASAEYLAVHAQAIVAVANMAAQTDADTECGIVAVPRRANAREVRVRKALHAPALLVCDMGPEISLRDA